MAAPGTDTRRGPKRVLRQIQQFCCSDSVLDWNSASCSTGTVEAL